MNIFRNKKISAKNTFAVIFVFIMMISVGVLGSFALSSVQNAFAAINKQINYQGKLTNNAGSAVSNGTYNMEFKLYSVSSGGSPLWTETRTSGDKVQVTNGLFSVLLGEVTSLSGVDFNQTLYLGVNIGGTSTPSWDGEMTPRKKLGAVPAAIVAETLNGLYSSQFFRNDATNSTSSSQAFFRIQQSGSGAIAEFIGSASTTAFIVTNTGNVGIGTSTPSASLFIQSKSGTDPLWIASSSASAPKALVFDKGGRLGIGINDPEYGIDVLSGFAVRNGVLKVGSQGISSEPTITFQDANPNEGTISFQGDTYGFKITPAGSVPNIILDVESSGGSVGVGTSTPSSRLSVAGDINLTGAIRANGSAGTSGQLLQSTGSGLTWVSTSTLASGLNYLRLENGGLATATSTNYLKAAYFTATSTTGTSTFAGVVGIGTSSPHWATLGIQASGNTSAAGLRIDNFFGSGLGGGGADAYGAYIKGTLNTGAAGLGYGLYAEGNATGDPDGTYGIYGKANGGWAIAGVYGVAEGNGAGVQGYSSSTGGYAVRGQQNNASGYGLHITGGKNYLQNSLGIGTTTPSSLLSVAGDINLTGALRANGNAGTAGMVLQTTGTGVQWVATSSLGISGGGSGTVNSGTTGQVAFYAANGTAVSGTSTLVLVGEKVGIGSSTPSTKLAVSGDGYFLGNLTTNGNILAVGSSNTFGTSTNSSGAVLSSVMSFSYIPGFNIKGFPNSQTAHYVDITSGTSGTNGDVFTILANGNLGISTSSPVAKLSVAGDAVITATTTTAVLNATNFWDNRRFTTLNDLYETRSYGRFTLQDYYVATSSTDLSASIATGISGATYNPNSNTVFMINNNTTSIYEFTLDGALLRTISLTNFPDPEALTWMYDDMFAIGDENTSTITMLRIATTTTTLNRTAATSTGIDLSATIPTGTNVGIEGLTYDSDRDVFYVIKEKTTAEIYKVTRTGTVTTLFNLTTLLTSVNMTDASDAYFDRNSQNLFITSDEGTDADKILQVNLQGTLISQIFAPTGFGQIEGIGFTPDGQTMFLSGENDTYARYEFARGNNLFALKSTTGADSGKVGIGTSSPVTTLTVRGSGGFDPFLIASSSNATMFVVSRNGNVGIGTSTPSSLLSVAGDINLTGALRANGNAGTAGMVLQTTGTGVQWVATSSLGISGGGGGGSGTVNSGLTGQVAFYAADGTAVSGTSTLFISGEKISIGTTTASTTFFVQGSSYVTATSTTNVFQANSFWDNRRFTTLNDLYETRSYGKFAQNSSYVSTSTAHVPSKYYLATSTADLSAALTNMSGATYNPRKNTVMIVSNSNFIYEYTLEGQLIRTISMTNFNDTEALGWMYDNVFVVGEEQGVSSSGSRITIMTISDTQTSIDRNNGTTISLASTMGVNNNSLEGVSYDSDRDVFYVIQEYSGTNVNPKLYTVTRSGATSSPFDLATVFTSLGLGDASDIYYDRNTQHFFIASDQCAGAANGTGGCDQVVELDYSGNVIDRIQPPNSFIQLEGIGFSPDGENMFMVGEADMYAWYRFQGSTGGLRSFALSSTTPWVFGIGTSSASSMLTVQGVGGVNPFVIASSSGSQLLSLIQNGSLGIGTSSPIAKLSVTGTSGDTSPLFVVASSSNSRYLVVSSTGSIGIGTSTPSSLLSVAGDINLTGAFLTNGNAGTAGMVLQTTGTGVQWVATSSLGISGGGGGSGTVNSGLAGQVAFYGANGTAVSGTSTLFISGEKIGIGTTTPGSKLVVVGTTTSDYLVVGGGTPLANSIAHFGADTNSFAQVNVQNRNSGTGASSDFVATSDDGNDSRYYIDFGINGSGYNNPAYSITGARDGYLYTSDGALAVGTASSTNANAVLKFHTGGTTAANERMRITATGDIGIGTTSPMTDLDVFGSMVLSALNSYLNFGNATGTVGYGFRDNAGMIQVKNSGGSWVNIPTSGTTQWSDTGSDIFFNTGNVGIGTTSPSEKLQVAGNILIGKRTDSLGSWSLRTQSTPGTFASGDTTSIGTTTAMAVYNGSLYAGTMKAGAAEVYRYNGGTSWTKVSSSTAGVISEDAGATSAINSVSSMAVYNGMLYVGTAKTGGAEVYQYNGNSTWTLISSTTAGAIGGAATTTAIDAVSAMVVHQGQLIIGTTKASGAEIYRYDVGVNNHSQRWLKLSHPQNAGTIGATTAVNGVTALLSHNGYLYVGVTKANGADVYRMDAPNPTNTFTRINAAAGSFTVATSLDNVRTLAVFNGSIFAGVDDGAGTARVVRWNGNYTAGTVWTGVSSTTAGVIAEDGGSQTGIDRVTSMSVYKNDLYIGTADSTGIGQVYKYDVGNTWSLVSSSTSGVIPTTGSGHNTGISGVTAMVTYNDDLWIGTEEASGAEVYSFNSVEGESNKLRFEAQSDNADGIQNALGNFGEIQFLAEENGRNVNGNMNTGVFSFSHGINTAVGAYDLAEDYPTRDDTLTPGDLVSLDIREKGFVRKAQGKNDRDIIGIYSVDPALRLSQKGPLIDGARAIPVALAGRVPVTVTLENGPIKIGDYLTSSLEPGKAAKANRPGRVVGRALGNYSGLEGEEAKVTVFLGLESIDWADIQSAQKDVEELADSTAPTDAGAVAEFVDTVNTAAEDLIFALLNKADNVSVVITNQFTTLFASIQELFVRTLAILPGGSFIVPSGENQISGTATMPAGATDVLIPNEQVDEQSIVYISPTSAIDAPLYVSRKVKGKGFHVRLKEPSSEDITFDWFFIKTYIPKNTQGNEVNAIMNQATSTNPGQPGTTTITIVSPDAGGVSSQAETTPIDEVSSGDVGSDGGTATSEGEVSSDSESDTAEGMSNESASDQQGQSQGDNLNSNESGPDTGAAPEAPVSTTPEPQTPSPVPSPDPTPSE